MLLINCSRNIENLQTRNVQIVAMCKTGTHWFPETNFADSSVLQHRHCLNPLLPRRRRRRRHRPPALSGHTGAGGRLRHGGGGAVGRRGKGQLRQLGLGVAVVLHNPLDLNKALRLRENGRIYHHWIGFVGKILHRKAPYLMGKSVVSGEDFPNKTNPMIP